MTKHIGGVQHKIQIYGKELFKKFQTEIINKKNDTSGEDYILIQAMYQFPIIKSHIYYFPPYFTQIYCNCLNNSLTFKVCNHLVKIIPWNTCSCEYFIINHTLTYTISLNIIFNYKNDSEYSNIKDRFKYSPHNLTIPLNTVQLKTHSNRQYTLQQCQLN